MLFSSWAEVNSWVLTPSAFTTIVNQHRGTYLVLRSCSLYLLTDFNLCCIFTANSFPFHSALSLLSLSFLLYHSHRYALLCFLKQLSCSCNNRDSFFHYSFLLPLYMFYVCSMKTNTNSCQQPGTKIGVGLYANVPVHENCKGMEFCIQLTRLNEINA